MKHHNITVDISIRRPKIEKKLSQVV